MSGSDKTALEKHGGLLGLAGICLFLIPKILKTGGSSGLYTTLAGVALLMTGCLFLAAANLRKEEAKNKVLGMVILLIVAFNGVLVYRAFFATGASSPF